MKILLLIVFSFAITAAKAAEKPPIIAVASNLRFVIEEIATSFAGETGQKVRFSFGSSGNLSRQILQGAPFQMFMSADEGYVFRLYDHGVGIDRGKIYGFGRIATFAPKGSPLLEASFPDGYRAYFGAGSVQHFAIANPELAPYGRAAKEALEHSGLWKLLQPRLIYGENISQTAQFTLSGSTLGGIIAYALVLLPQFRERGEFQLIPASWHKPLAQRMVLLSGAGEITRNFYNYIGGQKALQIFKKNGYIAP